VDTRILIKDVFVGHASLCFGLAVESGAEFPVVVGCSIRTPAGRIIDIPARYLVSPGLAHWEVSAPDECFIGLDANPHPWIGQIIFAVYEDVTFGNRLADTGWVEWGAPFAIGSSTAGLDLQDGQMELRYGQRLDVWRPLDS
jgi:hypothetical protein